MNNILDVSHISKKYKNFTLKDVSFSIHPNEIVGFVGENGAGKTTTVKIIGGVVIKNGGEVEFEGKPIETLSLEERSKIAITFDEPVFPDKMRLTKLEKIIRALFRNWDSPKFFHLLERFAIDKNKKVSELSKGMRAKLNLAIALSHDARLLILDEPANGLDPVARDDLLGLLVEFAKKENHAILVSSHIVSDLEKICSSFIFIHQGEILGTVTKKMIQDEYEIAEVPPTMDLSPYDSSIIFHRKDPLTQNVAILARKGVLDSNVVQARTPTVEEYALLLMNSKR